MKKSTLLVLFFITTNISQSHPCSRIVFDWWIKDQAPVRIGDVLVRWDYNDYCNGDRKRVNAFEIQIWNIFDEVIKTETVNGNEYMVPGELMADNPLLIVKVKEFNSDYGWYFTALKPVNGNQVVIGNVNDLNDLLLNGYFVNAVTEIYKLNRPDLEKSIHAHYDLLFPENYPGSRGFFNSYLNEKMELVTIPYVNGLREFEKKLNKVTKSEYRKGPDFTIDILVSEDNEIVEVRCNREEKHQITGDLVKYLSFDNRTGATATVGLKIGRKRSGHRYIIDNSRALTDPESKFFQKRFPYRGSLY